ncbi:hypothetical protein V501_03839 [Pseudogymnoascus sp. VKM F-4519 (FW-2642)]|nr:hypothetical protein V501_03839 [Pseudogymnoascus sp. VKM F-4519 (FW-2642)]
MPLPSFFFRSSSSLDINADALTDPSTSPSCTYLTTPSSRTTSSSHSAVDPTRRPSRYRIDSLFSAHSIDKSPSSSILSIDIESPPLVFYGGASTSTGALLTGQLKVDVREEEMEVEGSA